MTIDAEMKWQRARLLPTASLGAGCLIWVRVGAPEYVPDLVDAQTAVRWHAAEGDVRYYTTNLDHPLFGPSLIRSDKIELLPEFTTDAPMEDWDTFVARVSTLDSTHPTVQ